MSNFHAKPQFGDVLGSTLENSLGFPLMIIVKELPQSQSVGER